MCGNIVMRKEGSDKLKVLGMKEKSWKSLVQVLIIMGIEMKFKSAWRKML